MPTIETLYTILLVEDNDDHAELIAEHLAESRLPHRLVRVSTLVEATTVLATRRFTVILADLSLPDCDGLATVSTLQKRAPQSALIVLTANDQEWISLASLDKGAQDYLGKSELSPEVLARSIRYSMQRREHLRDIARKREELLVFTDITMSGAQSSFRRIIDLSKQLQGDHLPASSHLQDLINGIHLAATDLEQGVEDWVELVTCGESELDLELITLAEVVDEAQQKLDELITEKKALVEVGVLPTVTADRRSLVRHFEILIGNALHRSTDCDPVVTIENETLRPEVIITVTDNAPPIDSSIHEVLFEVSTPAEHRGGYTGLGLGLPLCRRIISAHGGWIQVDSVDGTGTNWRFSVPSPKEGSAV